MKLLQLWYAYVGLFRKETIRVFRIWPQSFVPSVVNTTLYFLIFGSVLGKKVGLIEGVSYIHFIAPGLILMSLIANAYANVVSSLYGARFNRSIEEILISPMPHYLVILGYISGGVIRGLGTGILVGAVASLFLQIHIAHLLLGLLTAFLCSTLFALAGFINGMLARNFDDCTIITAFILSPLSYLGGIFYNVHRLDHFWYIVSLFNPVYYLITLFRYAILGIPKDYHALLALGIVLFINLVLWIVCLSFMRFGVGLKS